MQGKKSFTPQLFVSVNLLDPGSQRIILQKIANRTQFTFHLQSYSKVLW